MGLNWEWGGGAKTGICMNENLILFKDYDHAAEVMVKMKLTA